MGKCGEGFKLLESVGEGESKKRKGGTRSTGAV